MPVTYDPNNDSEFSQHLIPTSPVPSGAAPSGNVSGGLADPNGLMSAWSSIAPNLPGGLLLQLGASGVSPADPVGQWVVKTALPALNSQKPVNNQMTEQDAASRILGNPTMLENFKKLPQDAQAKVFSTMTAVQAGSLPDSRLQHLMSTGQINVHHSFWNKIGDAFTTGVRDATTVLQAPAEVLQGAYRGAVMNPIGRLLTIPGLSLAEDIKGKKIATGSGVSSPMDVVNQTTLGQAIFHGQSLGGGFFSANSPAAQAQAQAARQAAQIAGHALTPGRAVASWAFQPGSRPYSIVSGGIDFYNAMEFDPSAHMLGALSDSVKEARLFAQTPEEARIAAAKMLVNGANGTAATKALRGWADTEKAKTIPGQVEGLLGKAPAATINGAPEAPNLVRDLADGMKTNPGLVGLIGHPDLVDQSGNALSHADVSAAVMHAEMGSGFHFRWSLQPKDVMATMNGPLGDKMVSRLANANFDEIYRNAKGKMPVDVIRDIVDANGDEDKIRSVLGANLGTTIQGVPEAVMPYGWTRPIQNTRMGAKIWNESARAMDTLPQHMVDSQDLNFSVEQARHALVSARVDPAFYPDLLGDIARSNGNSGDFYQAMHRVTGAIRDRIAQSLQADRNFTPENATSLANTLTLGHLQQTAEEQARWTDAMGRIPEVSGTSIGSMTQPIVGPYLHSELLNRYLPLPDMVEVNRQIGEWGKLWNAPGLGYALQKSTFMADRLTRFFKYSQIIRPGLTLRILADLQASAATDGLNSMFHHPMQWMARAVGHQGDFSEADLLGRPWADVVADGNSGMKAALGESSKWASNIWGPDKVISNRFVNIGSEDPRFMAGWEENFSRLHADGPAREVARALSDPGHVPAGMEHSGLQGLDAVKEWGWSGAGQKFRTDLARAGVMNGWSEEFGTNRQAWSDYLDSIAEQLHQSTGSNPDLLKAVGDGFDSKAGLTNLRANMRAAKEAGQAPNFVRTQDFEQRWAGTHLLHNAAHNMLHALVDVPTSKLRGDMFEQLYKQQLDHLGPWMADGTLTAEKADEIAKMHALEHLGKLAYNPGNRTNIMWNLRNVFPFGNAWQSILGRWAHLTAENPQVIRRVNQGVTPARQAGMFYTDPQTGHEVFNFIPGNVNKMLMEAPFAKIGAALGSVGGPAGVAVGGALGSLAGGGVAGVPFPSTMDVHGLNIIGQGIPGFGPVVQMAAAGMLPHNNAVTDGLRNFLAPYGTPDYASGFFESMFPGWLDKLRTSGYLIRELPGGSSVPFLQPTAHDNYVLTRLQHQIFNYYWSDGHYDQADIPKLIKRSQDAASRMYFLESATQFVAPGAPHIAPETRIKDGTLANTYVLTNHYRQMKQFFGNSNDALMGALNIYGPKTLFAYEGESQYAANALPTTEQAGIWRSQHADFANAHDETYAWFAPQGGNFSYQQYVEAAKRGDITAPKFSQWVQLGEARLGNAIYANLRSKLGVNPTPDQRNWLSTVRTSLTEQLPGFNQDGLKTSRNTLDQTVTDLRGAVNDPAVARTPVARAAATYIAIRDQALTEARNRTGNQSTGLSSPSMADLRDWLYQYGTTIAQRVPEFQTMWNDLFAREVEPSVG